MFQVQGLAHKRLPVCPAPCRDTGQLSEEPLAAIKMLCRRPLVDLAVRSTRNDHVLDR
ncbi:MAG: hypothetical protein ACJAYH_002600 [Celeribacter sp.]|jgi:hypothetical protein